MIAVKSKYSLSKPFTLILGLNREEIEILPQYLNISRSNILLQEDKSLQIEKTPMQVLNALARIGYKVVACSQEYHGLKIQNMSPPTYCYIAVKARAHLRYPHAKIYGLEVADSAMLLDNLNINSEQASVLENVIELKVPPLDVINKLGNMGYRVVTSVQSANRLKIIWTLEKDLSRLKN